VPKIIRFERRRLIGDLVHRCVSRRGSVAILEHDPEKWVPVFRKDHANDKLKRNTGSI
jgi:hypothetical protein